MKLSVIGLGKLGSPLTAVLASRGHELIGVDLNLEFIRKINEGIAPVEEPGLQELLTQNRSRIKATASYVEAVVNSEATFVIVPTPSEKDGFFTNRYLLEVIHRIGEALQKKSSYHLVVITSTVMPGSTDGEIRETLEKYRPVGPNLGLCYSPEFIALGSVVKNMLFPDMVLIGESDKKAGDLLEEISLSVCETKPPIRRMNLVNAEMTKIAINSYVTTKISYANMISDICQQLENADSNVVTDAIGLDTRIGSKCIRGAVAFGGPCFPRDSVALEALARHIGARADIAQATQQINHYQTFRLADLVKQHATSKKIGILGLAYKPNTYVVEESQGICMAHHLNDLGYEVSVYDPVALPEAKKVLLPEIYAAASVQECLERADTLLIMTPWPVFKEIVFPIGVKKVVIDCWRILPSECAQQCDLIYLGKKTIPCLAG